MYHPADVRWDVLNDIMSSYYLHNHRIFGLNALQTQDLNKVQYKKESLPHQMVKASMLPSYAGL